MRSDLQRQWRFRARNGEDGEDGEDVEREHEGDEEERRKTGVAIQQVIIAFHSPFTGLDLLLGKLCMNTRMTIGK